MRKTNFPTKSLAMLKKLKRGPFSFARYCVLRGKQEKPFGSVPWANKYNSKCCRTILVI